ncbi:MAG: hypothetical protein JWM59_1954 [Verrucomicrobiales bacterium]|nr:hypothetical protein [Verrucomicrobiales bacterium]
MKYPFLRRPPRGVCVLSVLAAFCGVPVPARASFLHGEALDTMAEVVSWVAIVVAPVVIITVFWLIHILPEKIAEKRRHPQAKAIQCLCLLSLFFGGLLWPIAWLWAYTRPTLHKLAYGTDTDDSHGPEPKGKLGKTGWGDHSVTETKITEDHNAEVQRLRSRVAELESLISNQQGGKA